MLKAENCLAIKFVILKKQVLHLIRIAHAFLQVLTASLLFSGQFFAFISFDFTIASRVLDYDSDFSFTQK